MNPNQMPPYVPYQGQYNKATYQNYQTNNNQQLNQSINNLSNNQYQAYQGNQVNQSNQYFKNDMNVQNNNFLLNRNRLDRAMYTSSIQPSTNNNANKNLSFSKLQSMGRFVTSTNTPQSNTQRNSFNNLNNINYSNTNTNINNNLTNNNNNNYNVASNQTTFNQAITSQNQANQNIYQGSNNLNSLNNANNITQPHKQLPANNQQNYQYLRQQKQKMFQSYIAPSQATTEFDRFPAFNLQSNSNQGQPNNINQSMQTINQNSQQIMFQQTPQQKRRRQILAIKQQLELINKKMQNNNFNKKYTTNNSNQLNLSSVNIQKLSNNAYNSSNNNNEKANNINNIQETKNSIDSNLPSINNLNNNTNTNTGLSFNRNLHYNNNQRGKGVIAQSMIVTTQPSSGYKFQSIFDKYANMKKPTYQTYQQNINNNKDIINQVQKSNNNLTQQINNKSDAPLLLDKFIKKGNLPNSNPIFQTLNKQKEKQQKKDNKIILDKTNTINTNFYQNGNNKSIETNVVHQQPLGMFKKKKQGLSLIEQTNNKFIEQKSRITSILTSPKNNIQSAMFKKTKQYNYQDNYVTSALKKMDIEESVQFTKSDFTVGKKLGKGQFGQVMLVQHKKTGFLCGMKVMQKKQIRQQKYQNQIARQLSVQFYLAHRNIAPLYGYFQDQKNVYLLVQYCTGGQLLQLLRKNRRMEQPQVSRIIKQIIEGIDYIHKELIIHRDIKPQNILFNFGVAKICDFGWAVYKGHGMRKTASVGSPLYYSPQIVMGVQYDQKIDIWDIGMMTYECILGKIPFRIYSQLDLNRIVQDQIKFPQYIDTTDQAKDFILKIMKKKPQQRMQIRQMLRHPFIIKYQDQKLAVQIMKDFKQVLSY